MIRDNGPCRQGQGRSAWLYVALTFCTLNTIWSFASQNDIQGLVYLLLSALYLLVGVLPHVGDLTLKRNLNALGVTLFVSFMLIAFGGDNRRLASAPNRVLPHVEMEVARTWAVTWGGERAVQAGYVFQILDVTLQSRRARGVEVDSYDFELLVGGARHTDALTDMAGSCDRRELPLGSALSCRVAFAVPGSATGGTLVFDDLTYTTWADASF